MSTKFNKILALLLVIVLSSTVMLAACGNSKKDSAEAPAEAPASSKEAVSKEETPAEETAQAPSGKITFYYWDENQRPGMDAVVDKFMEDTGIEVESTIIPWSQYWIKLQTSLPTENGPDVFWCNAVHAIDYYPAGLAEELTPYAERDGLDLSVFPDALLEMYSHEGSLYGLPKDYDTIGIFYNKEHFDEKSVDYPTENWTWDELREKAIALTDENTYGFVVQPSAQSTLHPFIMTNDGTYISEDQSVMHYNEPETIEAIQFLTDLIFVDQVSPTGATQQELNANEHFQSGLASMISAGCWSVPPFYEALGDNLGVAQIPISKQHGNIIHGLSFTMSSKSQNKEAAWELIKAFATKEAGEAQANVVIPAYEGAEQLWLDNYPTLDLHYFIEAAEFASPRAAATIDSAAQQDVVDSYIQKMWIEQYDVTAACEEIDEQCEAIVAEAK